MYLYNAPRAHDLTRLDAAYWLADKTGVTPDEARARILEELVPDVDGEYDDEALRDLAISLIIEADNR